MTVRTRSRTATGWPAVEAAIRRRLGSQPGMLGIAAVLALLGGALYLAALDFPLVFGDFPFLAPQRLEASLRALPQLGGTWLAEASFGWSAALFDTRWPWHRALNVGLHVAAAIAAFGLFRRILIGTAGAPRAIASGWIAFVAAALFAAHPVAVYGVAYLSARSALLLGLLGLLALWSTARSLQTGGRFAWLGGPLAVAVALTCGPSALGIPVAMAFIALALPAADSGARRAAWMGVVAATLIALAYALAWAATSAAPGEGVGSLDALAASSTRFLRYLGFWLLPDTGRMAIDMPEAPISAGQAWPGWLGIVGVGVLALAIAAVVVRVRSGLVRAAAIGIGCSLAIYAAELLWPRLGVPFALERSYAFMPCAVLAPACLIALLPARAAWVAGCLAIALALVAAADTVQSFSSHIALWDDAVHRAERIGPRPEDARIYLNRATVHRHDGHTFAALADYDRALALQPGMTRALRGRAQVYVDERRYGEALRDLDRLLEIAPGQAITHADRGLALMQAGRLTEAGQAFDRAVQFGVREPRVFLNRGLARLQLGGLGAAPAALADIERALALDPGYALAYYNRAMVFEQAANAGIRLRDALSPDLMRAVAERNLARACKLGHAGACERVRVASDQAQPGAPERAESLPPGGLPATGAELR